MKYKLSDKIGEIFRSANGCYMYVVDIPTGAGKTYSMAMAAAMYKLSQGYDQIVFLTVQNKLCEEMMECLRNIIAEGKTDLSEDDIIWIKKNSDTIQPAYEKGYFEELFREIRNLIASLEVENDYLNKIKSSYEKIEPAYRNYVQYADFKSEHDNLKIYPGMVENYMKSAANLIQKIKETFRSMMRNGKMSKNFILDECPTLFKVFPQLAFENKKIIVTNIHKNTAGIDMIFDKNITLRTYAQDQDHKRLIILDESDQCAIAIRQYFIENMVGGNTFVEKNYSGVLQIKNILRIMRNVTMYRYMGELHAELMKCRDTVNKVWKSYMGDTPCYTDIFLRKGEDKERMSRRGTFLIGNSGCIRLYNSEQPNSYICYRDSDTHLTLAHAKNAEDLEGEFEIVVDLSSFIRMCIKIHFSLFYYTGKFAKSLYERSCLNFDKKIEEAKMNPEKVQDCLRDPSLENAAYLVACRFFQDSGNRSAFSNQLVEFIESNPGIFNSNAGEKGSNEVDSTDTTIYSKGLKFYYEHLDENDDLKHVNLTYVDFERMAEREILNLVNDRNTVILCSATASARSVAGNFDIGYFKMKLGDRYKTVSFSDHKIIQELLNATYPKDYRVKAERVEDANLILNGTFATNRIPDYYRSLFSPLAVELGLVDWWYSLTIQQLKRNLQKKSKKEEIRLEDVIFPMARLLQFADVYSKFHSHDDINSMLYFQNSKGTEYRQQMFVIASLIDGSFVNQPSEFIAEESDLPTDWSNPYLYVLEDWEEIKEKVIPRLESTVNNKLMLVTAYNTIKVGCNLQYRTPENIDVLIGDTWDNGENEYKKDWDAVYLLEPTNYLSVERDKHAINFWTSKYHILLNLGMFYENGIMSSSEVARWASQAFFDPNHFMYYGESTILDKSAWIMAILEQAVGRICRTKVKNATTYIFFDSKLDKYFTDVIGEKAMTMEFATLKKKLENKDASVGRIPNMEEKRRIKKANMLFAKSMKNLNAALKYNNMPEDELDKEEKIHISVEIARERETKRNDILARYPVIGSYDELTESERNICDELWNDWPQDEEGNYYYFSTRQAENKTILVAHNHPKAGKPKIVSPETTRLSYMMKCRIIKEFFEKNGYATSWGEGLLLNPNFIVDRYTGYIGELAFKAILLGLELCKEEDFIDMSKSRNWEVADFVISLSDGRRIAFDVKNYNPDFFHVDGVRDKDTVTKRREKIERLGCHLVTVNILDLGEPTNDALHEIGGLIDKDGNFIPKAINQLKMLLK